MLPIDLHIDMLRCFMEVARTGSFTKAGNNIGLTQSGVSVKIRRLEERLSSQIFNRTSKSLSLTLEVEILVVVGVPTVLAGPHPLAAYATLLANALRPKAKFLSIIGSYGWGGKTVETLAGMIPNLKVEVLEPVLCKGVPADTDFEALDRLAGAIAQKHEENAFR